MADMRNKWTSDDDAVIVANVGKLTYADIAVRLGTGVHKAQVARRAKHLGLAGNNENPVRSKGNPSGPRPRKVVRRVPDSRGSAKGGSVQQVTLREPKPVPVEGLVCEPVSVSERGEFQCGWPLDGNMCCGLHVMKPYVVHGRRVTPPYCPAHQNHSTQPSKYKAGIWRGP